MKNQTADTEVENAQMGEMKKVFDERVEVKPKHDKPKQ